MTEPAKQPRPVCTCGDWQTDHVDGVGRCRLCSRSRYPWDHCERYEYWRDEVPLV